jgi:hypothetical protein
MEYLIFGAFNCVAQCCCWYNVFRCCGCIEEENRHVQIEKQAHVINLPPPKLTVKGSDNPFINPNVPKDQHISFSYKT